MKRFFWGLTLLIWAASLSHALEPIPDRLVVLTFDDANKSHFTVARPMLKKHRFGATFFVTEGFDSRTNQEGLHDLGRDCPVA